MFFSLLSPGNDWQMHLKHSPSLSRSFTNYLISPDFICRGGSIILSLGTRGSFIMFLLPALSVIRDKANGWLYRDCPTHIRSTAVFISRLLPKQKIHHFQIDADFPVMLAVFYALKNLFYWFILLLQRRRMTSWN